MKYWIWLSLIPYVGPVTANLLLNKFENPENIYMADDAELSKVVGITRKQISNILQNKSLEYSKNIIEECREKHISILLNKDQNYPLRAKKLQDAPIVLYYKGSFQKLDDTIGIVGARRCSQEARQKAISLTEEYTERGVTIISGMAKGIDSYAHTSCIKKGGYTVAIVGNGLDICYPSEHMALMKKNIR